MPVAIDGTTMFRPGCSDAWNLPSRSTTQAFCCGTTFTAFTTNVTATTSRTTAISDSPSMKGNGMEFS